MSKKSLTFLIAGFIAFLVLILIIAGIFAAVLISKTDDEKPTDTSETTEDSETDEETPEVTSKDLFAIVNCKLYQVTPTKVNSVVLTNKTKVKCFDNKIIDADYTLLNPTSSSLNKAGVNANSLYMIDLATKSIVEIKYSKPDQHTAVYDSTNKKLYSYLVTDGLYTGTFAAPLTQKIYTADTELFGRGGMLLDEVALRLSPDLTKVAIVDTITSENKDGSAYMSIKVTDTTGTVLFSDDGTKAKWLSNSKLVYLNANLPTGSTGQTVVRDFSANTTSTISGYETAYHYDVLGDYLLVDYFKTSGSYKSVDLKTAVLKISDGTLVNDKITKKSDNYLLNTTTVIGHATFDCSGEFDSGAAYPCPMDGPSGFYQKNINAHDLTVNSDKTLIAYTTPTLY